jgi:hypothetical protein
MEPGCARTACAAPWGAPQRLPPEVQFHRGLSAPQRKRRIESLWLSCERFASDTAAIDLSDMIPHKYDLDVVGRYARPAVFGLHMNMRKQTPVRLGEEYKSDARDE